jgi:hypothetical protein
VVGRSGRVVAAMAMVVAIVLGVFAASPTPARAGERPTVTWTGTNPYGFALGDSVLQQCGEGFGMGWRSLGFVGWPGANTRHMRERLTIATEGWSWTTERSNAEERQWFRDAGFLVIALGTNDVKELTAAQFRDNVNWFMSQSRGRPVAWFDIHNPPFQTAVDAFNAELRAATDRWPNLKVIPWDRFVRENPSVVTSDQVHVATAAFGCEQARNRLVQFAAPHVPGRTAPLGYWYEDWSRSGPVRLNGWGAGNVNSREAVIAVNIRSDGGHVARFPVSAPTSDIWAQTASGRAFSVTLTENFRGHHVCLDLVDAAGQFTSLGCRVPLR